MNHIKRKKNNQDYHMFEESFKRLRTNLFLLGDGYQVISITSSEPSEGKSLVSRNLAKSIALTKKKVIYIDADLRKVKTHSYRKDKKELANYLMGECQLKEAIYNDKQGGYDCIYSFHMMFNAIELIESKGFSDMVELLKAYYDYIIIDTPPILRFVDGISIAKVAKHVILVIEAHQTNHRMIRRIKHELSRVDCQLLGVVLNKTKEKSHPYIIY